MLLFLAMLAGAELSGTVQDPASLPVEKAAIAVTERSTNAHFATVSDNRGVYHLLGLPAGEYVLTVYGPAFREYRRSGIVLRMREQAVLDVRLELGAREQTLEVSGAA